MRQITQSSYLDTDWQDEKESIDLMKKGHYVVHLYVVNTDLYIRITSSLEHNGSVYTADSDEIVASGLTGTPTYILFDSGTFSTSTSPDLSTDYDQLKNGYYYNGSRIIGYWDGSSIGLVNINSGKQS